MNWLAPILAGVLFIAIDARGDAAQNENTLYDPNPSHLWNRLHETLFVRAGSDGKKYGFDELDDLFWSDTKYLLIEPSHHQALAILDEFLNTHGEKLIHDPLKRALLQRDLWELFDWSASPYYWKLTFERQELQQRLAIAIRRLALDRNEIASLPDNYAIAETSNLLTNLPQGLFRTNGDWMSVGLEGGGDMTAPQHVAGFEGRSVFLVFVRMPGGRSATFSYFDQLRAVEHPWIYKTGSFLMGGTTGVTRRVTVSPALDLPQFSTNTQWALVRRMCVIDTEGHIQMTSLTESIQVRRYLELPLQSAYSIATEDAFGRAQQFREFVMNRRREGMLQAVGDGEKEFRQFMSVGTDPFEWQQDGQARRDASTFQRTVLEDCKTCHSSSGIYSVLTYSSRVSLLPPSLVERSPKREAEVTISWKHNQFAWGLLQGMWSRTNWMKCS